MKTISSLVALVVASLCLYACEGCEEKKQAPALPLPFSDNFNRQSLGQWWTTQRPGRWKIQYDAKTSEGQLCVEQARNNHIFLRGRLPRDVVVEFDAVAKERDGDVKIELFSDGKYAKTGYVLVHGGWNNSLSIIDRLDEHNKNRRVRKSKSGGPIVVKGRKYHWKATRYKDEVKWYLDGKLYMRYKDPLPLEGKAHAYFAIGNWIARVCYDNIKIDAYEPKSATPTPTRAVRPVVPAPAPTPAPAPAPTPMPQKQPLPTPPQNVPVRPKTPKLRVIRKRPVLLKLPTPNRPLPLQVLTPQLRKRRIYHIRRLPARRNP